MPIIAYLGKDIIEYNAESQKYLDLLHFYCPSHGSELRYHDKYNRQVKDYKTSISVHRLKCPFKNCPYTQAILPDFLQPYKQYSAHEITNVLVETEPGGSVLEIDSKASVSTVRRWISQYETILDEKTSQIKALIFQKTKMVVNEMTLSIKPMETIHKLFTYLPAINCTNTLGAAFIYSSALSVST